MQLYSPDTVKDALLSSISSLLEHRDLFLMNPDSDFSRTKKISFVQTLLFPMVAASDNVPTELMDFFDEAHLLFKDAPIYLPLIFPTALQT